MDPGIIPWLTAIRRYTCGHTIKKHQAEALLNCDHWIDFVLSSRKWLNDWAGTNDCLIFLGYFSVLEISGKKWNEADPPGIYHLHRFQLILLHFIPGLGMSQDFRYKIDLQPVCVPQLHVPYYPIRAKLLGGLKWSMLRFDSEGLGDLYPSAWCEIPTVMRTIGHTEFGPSDLFCRKMRMTCKTSSDCFWIMLLRMIRSETWWDVSEHDWHVAWLPTDS